MLVKLSICTFFVISGLISLETVACASSKTKPSSNSTDIWYDIGQKIDLDSYQHNYLVQKKIKWYAAHQDVLYSLTQNAQPYIYYVSQQVEKNRMPMELALLPMIESDYLPNQRSSSNALGLWQLQTDTARGLGVHMNWWYDGRKDVVTSTHAALAYLKYLHRYFHSWPLALAAYNAGIGKVSKAIAYNQARHRSTDYWSLPLPQETKDYVPKLLAVATIFAHPKAYNLVTHPVQNEAYFTQVRVHKRIPLSRVATLATTTLATLKKLNPGINNHKAIPTNDFNVLVPANKAKPLSLKLAEYTEGKKA